VLVTILGAQPAFDRRAGNKGPEEIRRPPQQRLQHAVVNQQRRQPLATTARRAAAQPHFTLVHRLPYPLRQQRRASGFARQNPGVLGFVKIQLVVQMRPQTLRHMMLVRGLQMLNLPAAIAPAEPKGVVFVDMAPGGVKQLLQSFSRPALLENFWKVGEINRQRQVDAMSPDNPLQQRQARNNLGQQLALIAMLAHVAPPGCRAGPVKPPADRKLQPFGSQLAAIIGRFAGALASQVGDPVARPTRHNPH
tara:strand:+ start:1148 stop:1897 length:750 start_codon:yes stop_codon:yes gene_type:complete